MSGSRVKLEQILELLLAEDSAQAEELLHEYVVATARAQYESLLEDDDEIEIDDTEDFSDEISSDEDSVDDEMTGDIEDTEDSAEFDDIESEESGDIEDKVDELEAELEELRAEFERLVAGDDDSDDMDMGDDFDTDEISMDDDSSEFDDFEDEEEVMEATNFSNKVAAPKGGADDGKPSPFTKSPSKTFTRGSEKPSFPGKDGSNGTGAGAVKKQEASNNMGIKPQTAATPSNQPGDDAKGKNSPLTRKP
jgi:hypothetical protein